MTFLSFAFLSRSRERSGGAGRAAAAGTRRGLAKFAAVLLVVCGIAHAAPAAAETATLFEQAQPQGKRFPGTVTWRVEQEPAGARHGRAVRVRADIAIPERHMTASFVLSRNADRSLPATHTIEIMFKFPPDFPGHGLAQLPGVTLKPTEQGTGTPLAGLTAKVTPDFFLIGLSAMEGDAGLNRDILRDGKWLDILMVYANGTRAILTLEKGASGTRAFDQALAAWGKAASGK